MNTAKLCEMVAEISAVKASECGASIWDVEFVREGREFFLRVYIDAPGGVFIDQCESVSRYLSDELDKLDPIEQPYCLEVSSAGVERTLKTDRHFEDSVGHEVDIKFFAPINGKKTARGRLLKYQSGVAVFEIEGNELTIEKEKLALVKWHEDFKF